MTRCALFVAAVLAAAAPLNGAPRNLVLNGGFEGGEQAVAAAGWTLHDGAAIEPQEAFEGRRCVRVKAVGKPTSANSVRSGLLDLEPNAGYVARCRYRLTGTSAHLTFGVVDAAGAFVVCRDFYAGLSPHWGEAVLPFRTGPTRQLRLSLGRRYGKGEILFDSVELTRDDSVRVGDVSAGARGVPEPTAAEKERGYIVSSRRWLARVGPACSPARGDVTRALACRLTPGEAEPVTFAVTALQDLRDVRAALESDLVADGGQRLDAASVSIGVVRSVKRWLTNSAPLKPGQRFERLPLFIYPNQSVPVTAGETQRFWLTIQAPADAVATVYRGRITVSAADRPPVVLPLSVEVLPFVLAEPDVTYGMYYRQSHQDPELVTDAFFRRVLDDMRSHGMNSFSVYADLSEKLPDGTARLNLDGGSAYHYRDRTCGLRWQLQRLEEHGLRRPQHPLLLLADHRFNTDPALIKAFYEDRDPTWPEFLLYLVDEPHTPEQIEQARRLNALAHTVPGLRTTTAIGHPGELADAYDVWIVSTSAVDFMEIRQLAHDGERELWAYNCNWNGSQPLNDRYYAGLYTWWAGLRGNWQWCYTEGYKASSDFSAELPLKIPFYEDPWYAVYVLPTPETNIPTAGWEARREGIDDYRYLLTLRQAIEAAEAGVRRAGRRRVRAAKRFLRDLEKRARRPDLPVPAAVPERTYSFRLHPGLDAEDLDAIRSQAIEHIMAMTRSRDAR